MRDALDWYNAIASDSRPVPVANGTVMAWLRPMRVSRAQLADLTGYDPWEDISK